MMRSKLLRLVTYHNKSVICMSTNASTETILKDKKFEHYKNLQALQETSNTKPSGWDEAKPFSAIPGPNPLMASVYNVLRFFAAKRFDTDIADAIKTLSESYGDIVAVSSLFGKKTVMLFNPKDFETLFRNEGIWPIRENLPCLEKYMKSREHIFPNTGLVAHHGEKWFQFRSTVNPILMQPRNIAQYTDKMDQIAGELVSIIKYLSEQNPNGEMAVNFNNELYKWALESVALVTLDTRLGCLKQDLPKDSEAQKIINTTIQMFHLIHKLDLEPSLYKYISTPNWKKLVAGLDFMISTNIKHINSALEKIEKEPEDPDNPVRSVLHQLLKKDKNVAVAMARDMIQAGIDTTGRVLGASLYFLSKNPTQQEELRKEAKALLPSKDTPITKEILAKAAYLKACVKETTRLAPVAVGNTRTTVKDLVLGGYQIPKGIQVVSTNLLICKDERYFPKGKEFLPERWLSTAPEELSRKNTNPFIYAPFGFGPRSCIGKRLATLELETAILKIVRNFELTWPHEDMVFATHTIYGIARPLKIHVKPVEN